MYIIHYIFLEGWGGAKIVVSTRLDGHVKHFILFIACKNYKKNKNPEIKPKTPKLNWPTNPRAGTGSWLTFRWRLGSCP